MVAPPPALRVSSWRHSRLRAFALVQHHPPAHRHAVGGAFQDCAGGGGRGLADDGPPTSTPDEVARWQPGCGSLTGCALPDPLLHRRCGVGQPGLCGRGVPGVPGAVRRAAQGWRAGAARSGGPGQGRAVDRAGPAGARVRPSARPEPIPNLRSGVPEGGACPDGRKSFHAAEDRPLGQRMDRHHRPGHAQFSLRQTYPPLADTVRMFALSPFLCPLF